MVFNPAFRKSWADIGVRIICKRIPSIVRSEGVPNTIVLLYMHIFEGAVSMVEQMTATSATVDDEKTKALAAYRRKLVEYREVEQRLKELRKKV